MGYEKSLNCDQFDDKMTFSGGFQNSKKTRIAETMAISIKELVKYKK